MKFNLKILSACVVLLAAMSSCESDEEDMITAPVAPSNPSEVLPPSEEEIRGGDDWEVGIDGSNGIGDKSLPPPVVVNPRNKKGTFHRVRDGY